MAEEAYQRILLKLSGEALLGQEDYGIDPVIIHRIAVEIGDVTRARESKSPSSLAAATFSAAPDWPNRASTG